MGRPHLLRLIAGATLLAAPVTAQAPPRPDLGREADTLDARTYFQHALRRIAGPDAFAAAWWASRLEPDDSRYTFAMWLTRLVRARDQVEVDALDSLYDAVLLRDPFPYLEGPCSLPRDIERVRDPAQAGYRYWRGNCHRQAADHFAEALAADPGALGLHFFRAQSLYFQRQYRSARGELTVLIDSLRARDEESTRRVYLSKAFLEYAVGVAAQRMGEFREARDAFGRALTEDLTYYMAHARLGDVAAAQGALPEAAAEYEMAVGLAPDDGVLRFRYGVVLLRMSRLVDAETQLREAVGMEPHWMEPYGQLAVCLDRQDRRAEAAAMYREYAVRVPDRLSNHRLQALSRAAELETP